MGLSFFKLPKYKVYDYQPRFYDPDKERWEERKRALGLDSIENYKEKDPNAIPEVNKVGQLVRSGAMRARHDQFQQKMQKQKKVSRIIVVGLVLVMSVMIYLYLTTPVVG
ncbi:MAG: hypothetical protein MJZ18_02175 [Bacteroidales bacterium]|nr:hypothetical protein [Bacteroidales bacterium]